MHPERVYIAGPISNMPDHNKAAFERATEMLGRRGYVPVNPHTLHDDLPDDAPHSAYMRNCIRALMDCDRIYLLPRWQHSRGARLEQWVASMCGIRELTDDELRP